MKIISIVGTRPQFIKIAPLIRALNNYADNEVRIEHSIIHTGQHYDPAMSEIFFDELEIAKPDFNLFVGSGTHGYQTGRMLIELEKLLFEFLPDLVLIYGDTNSTLAGALAASKMHILTAHIEAGLRSFNMLMPEENNRIVSDHISDILFAPTKNAVDNLIKEGLGDRTVLSGDIMLDSILFNKKLAEEKSKIIDSLKLSSHNFIVCTIHRAENTDDLELFLKLLNTLNEIASAECPVIIPIHPRAKKSIAEIGWNATPNVMIIPPAGPLDMISLVSNARFILTDSGGLQKEALFLNCPCITLRNETEWLETIWCNANIVAGTDKIKILNAVQYWNDVLKNERMEMSNSASRYFGNGKAADVIVDTLVNYFDQVKRSEKKQIIFSTQMNY